MFKNAVRMRVATEEEVKALAQQQQQERQRLQQLQQLQQQQQQQQEQKQIQKPRLKIESVARSRRSVNTKQAQQQSNFSFPFHPQFQIPQNVIVKKMILPPTPTASQLSLTGM